MRAFFTIYFFHPRYHSKDDKLTSDTYSYKRGSNQMFVQTDHVFDPSSYSDEELYYTIEKDIIPVAIQCVALEGVDGKFNFIEKIFHLSKKKLY